MIGRAISYYQVPAKLGAGGMGEVYRARVAADGQRFLVTNIVEDMASQPITAVLNWTAA